MIYLHEKRVTFAYRYRLPKLIWLVLYSLAAIAMAMGGYDSGLSRGRRIIGINLGATVAFSLIFVVLVAMDRNHQNLLTTTKTAILDLQEHVRETMETRP